MQQVLMCNPRYFDVPIDAGEKNYWMNPKRRPDKIKAFRQWDELRSFYKKMGVSVHLLKPRKAQRELRRVVPLDTPLDIVNSFEGLFDQVFTANVAWGIGKTVAMANPDLWWRKPEVKYAAQWFAANSYRVEFLPEHIHFEGQGDVISLGEHGILFCYGIRNDLEAKEYLEVIFGLGAKLTSLKLISPRYYHGDMCIRYSSHHDAILYNAAAFDSDSLRLIENLPVKNKMEAPSSILVQNTEDGFNFPLNGCSIGRIETFPWDPRFGEFPKKVKKWIEEAGCEIWHSDFSVFGLSGAGHRCVTCFID